MWVLISWLMTWYDNLTRAKEGHRMSVPKRLIAIINYPGTEFKKLKLPDRYECRHGSKRLVFTIASIERKKRIVKYVSIESVSSNGAMLDLEPHELAQIAPSFAGRLRLYEQHEKERAIDALYED